jgi:hypothetical protein
MSKLLLATALLLAFVACTAPAASHAPSGPELLRVPAGNKLILEAQAQGVQIYVCRPKKEDAAQYEWAFKAPDARLADASGRDIGHHYAGPTWESTDGSKVIGKVDQKVDAPGADDIPWLLLSAKSNEGGGRFGKVTFIQRVSTHGGKAPSGGCDSAHSGQEVRVEYTATYRFYVAGS